ncbi:mRNA turnover protein 4 homolog [Hydra vulgaris]|uniref:Ribosome assembly factor mrt4 n=1 Tax=Hydra vulgaris TaxID=6087 RepID=T2M3M9_HYDVU|nr:mRNA turnover protein 4 homolog [Hydra vulgaris]
MPKSRRNKVISLSKTTKKEFQTKKSLVDEIRKCCDEYTSLYVFSVENMRNDKLKDVRQKWKTSRFFYGKNKVMAFGLGRTKEIEYKENLHKISSELVGNVGIMFTNESQQVVKEWFEKFSEVDYARSGNTATQTVTIPEGPLDENSFQYTMEPVLRALGLPVILQKGVIHLTQEYTVCKEGDTLSPEQCKVLKLFSYPLAVFHITLKCVWHSTGQFELFNTENE